MSTDAFNKTYDYVIVGGGTAGLVIASRLSSDPSISVVVLEAGEAHNPKDPNIIIPGQYGSQFGIPKYDWAFQTVPQRHLDDRQVLWSRGKGLGGSSAINFQAWTFPPSQDIDAIEALGNPGWNWIQFKKYEARVREQVKTCVSRYSVAFDHLFSDTLVGMGLKKIDDPYNGDITGAFVGKVTIDPETWTRSYSANAYYSPEHHPENLTLITEAAVTRVLFDNPIAGDLTATGVEFIYDGKTYVLHSSTESPHILELSGIGRRDVLEQIGVDVKVELPGVGENVQEHLLYFSTHEMNPGETYETLDLMRDPVYAAERLKFHADGKGTPSLSLVSIAYVPLSFASPDAALAIIQDVERKVEELKGSGTLPPGLAEQYDIQLRILRDPALPDCQVVVFPGYQPGPGPVPYSASKTYIAFTCIGNHTFSRGTIHAKSSDPMENPIIDPHYFEMDFDLKLMVEHHTFLRRITAQEPLKSALSQTPDPESDADTAHDSIKKYMGTPFHTVGSCSMLPRSNNGVVSPELVVYGTKNLRVADLSIIPLHIAAHTQATAYVIGEKAADLIRGL